MDDSSQILPIENIQNRIYTFRGVQVMIDSDLAEHYGVEVKRLNEQVKRNITRFPYEFRFQLSESEKNELVANCDRFNKLKHSTSPPYAFTEQGVSMLSSVLRSATAINASITIINAFVQMRKFLINNASVYQRLETIEHKQIITDSKIETILNAIESKDELPKQNIFFNGQFFDAYLLISDIIKSANNSIVLIDNYIDETVLTMLDKRKKEVNAIIYTPVLTKKLSLDLQKHNQQYSEIKIKIYSKSHDRFIIIDNKDVYHIGASIKDLGKKIFAFSKIDFDANYLIEKLNQNTK